MNKIMLRRDFLDCKRKNKLFHSPENQWKSWKNYPSDAKGQTLLEKEDAERWIDQQAFGEALLNGGRAVSARALWRSAVLKTVKEEDTENSRVHYLPSGRSRGRVSTVPWHGVYPALLPTGGRSWAQCFVLKHCVGSLSHRATAQGRRSRVVPKWANHQLCLFYLPHWLTEEQRSAGSS